MLDLVDKIEQRLNAIDKQMADPDNAGDQKKLIQLNRERRTVANILEAGEEYRKVKVGMDEALEIIAANEDAELVEMAKEELAEYEAQIEEVEQNFKLELIPKDPTDDKPAIVEMRAGTGGDEAGLFVGDIFRMYQKWADTQGWKLDVISSSETGVGGFKEIIFSLEGESAYGTMKYESGVHRVQRVPQTETQGRIHTSAISVAVLPEAQEIDIAIKENEIKVDVYRSSGPGGQSVNTTDSAVRLTHLPTGLVVMCQDEKSQHKNRAKALKVLRARLYDKKLAEQRAKIDAERRTMVSSGDRSAKIRTYNFPQSRVTDHRINLTLYKLDQILQGDLSEVIGALQQYEQNQKLKIQEEIGGTS